MAIPAITSIEDWNARNPCCCPLPVCVPAVAEIEARVAESCRGGWPPNFMSHPETGPEPFPGAFSLLTTGVRIPVYKVSTDTDQTVTTAVKQIDAELYGAGDVLEESFTFTGTTDYDYTETQISEWQRPREYWVASDWPLGGCPPEDALFPVAVTGLAVALGTPAAGLVTVTLTWADGRESYTPEGAVDAILAGGFEVLIDGASYGSAEAEFEIDLNEGDVTCHEFQVRHVTSVNGQWSAPFAFSLNSSPCCVPRVPACNDWTVGNMQHSLTMDEVVKGGEMWATGTASGDYTNCAGDATADLVDTTDLGLSLGPVVFPGAGPPTITVTPAVTTETYVGTVAIPNVAPAADPSDHTWQLTHSSQSGTSTVTRTVTKSGDQNTAGATAAMFAEVLATFTGWDDTYGWGLSGTDGWLTDEEGVAQAVEYFPETEGNDNAVGLQRLFVTVRQLRYRWYVPVEHTGTGYKTVWQIGRFSDVWVAWREDYFTWAEAKYAFLNRPEVGDDDYPVIGDFVDDPGTGEDEAAAALAAAIAALPQDPGAAPVEPAEVPEIIESPAEWVWEVSQPEATPEVIGECDPTRTNRELVAPVAPDPADFADTESYDAAVVIYTAALAAYEADVAARAAASRRQSEWFFLTPDRASDYRARPAPVPPLGDSPTAGEIEAHATAEALYSTRLARYLAGIHETFRLCNVRHVCGISPAGEIKNYDHAHFTTELPALDPSAFDPSRYVDWYRFV